MRAAAALALTLLGEVCAGPRDPAGPPPGSTPSPEVTTPVSQEPTSPRPERQVVWVSVEDDQRVVAIDLRARKVIRRLRVSGTPHNVTITGDTVAVALQDSGRVALIRKGKVNEVELGGSPHDVKPFRELVVVANEGAARLDLVSVPGDLVDSIALKANPHDLAIAPDRRTAWVTLDGSDEMAVVNLERRRVLRYVPTGSRPHDLIFTPDGRLWVTDWGGGLHVFSRRGRLLRTFSVGVEAHHLAFSPGTGRQEVWLTDHGAHRVFVIDVGTLKVEAELDTGGAPHHVAITPDGRWAVVVDHDGDRILVYRARTRRLVARIPVGEGPHGVWAEPAR
jgi:YVTN family beta-propeller protein